MYIPIYVYIRYLYLSLYIYIYVSICIYMCMTPVAPSSGLQSHGATSGLWLGTSPAFGIWGLGFRAGIWGRGFRV